MQYHQMTPEERYTLAAHRAQTATTVERRNRPAHGTAREHDQSRTAPQRITTRWRLSGERRAGTHERQALTDTPMEQAHGQAVDARGGAVARGPQPRSDQRQIPPRWNVAGKPRDDLPIHLG